MDGHPIDATGFIVWLFIVWFVTIKEIYTNKFKKPQKSNKSLIFVAGFLSLNPGLFILLLYGMVKNYAESYQGWNRDISTILVIFIAILLGNSAMRVGGVIMGKKNRNFKNPRVRSIMELIRLDYNFSSFLSIILLATAFYYLSGVLRIYTGSVMSVNIIQLLKPAFESIWFFSLYIVTLFLYSLFLIKEFKLLAFEKAFLRHEAMKRLIRMQQRVEGTRTIFGKTHTYYRQSSSHGGTLSSGTSRSSSSSGGRSGGGGASSRW